MSKNNDNTIIERSYDDLIGFPDNKNDSMETPKEKAFKIANECRDKEIDRFWTRGLYFWGFIVASFGAYMALFNASLKNEEGSKVAISFSAILEMSFTSKILLLIISFICFVFCISWLLAQKGSKFWQQNWETHIDYLEKDCIGKLFESYLDTDNNKKFKKCILKTNAYDYSVSKISLLCSMLISFCSFALVLFHIIILAMEFPCCRRTIFSVSINIKNINIKTITCIIVIVFAIIFLSIFIRNVPGNKDKKKEKNKEKNKKQKNSGYDPEYTYFKQNKRHIKITDNLEIESINQIVEQDK